ncbi:phosphodiester glycosidase family protein [Streptomyces sp. NPDC060194]|uniref:phosphodiester glycosidase family protein n=1 Tax=Streptomyces sp. NPDC060194 TaxID=3347069 RepID=UPI00366155AD
MTRARFARPATAVAAASALLLGGAVQAAADPLPPPDPRSVTPAAPSAPGLLAVRDGDGLETARTSRPVAPGTELTSYDRLESDKWLRVDELTVDLDGPAKADYLYGGEVADRRTVSELAAAHDPGKGRRTVAAFNGDFFDINETGAPIGVGLDDGELVNSAQPDRSRAVGFDADGAGRVLDLYFEGTLTLPDGAPRKLGGLNPANVPAAGIAAYTSRWGTADRALTVNGAARGAEVTVVDGEVTETASAPGKGAIPAGATVLVGRDAGADALSALAEGDEVSWEYRPRAGSGATPRAAIGANEYLVVDGEPVDHEGAGNNATAPRTAVGFSRDGREMTVLSVDGRQADSGGVTLTELGLMMRKAGAYQAINLDGGGSSTLLTRRPGRDALGVDNQPSDGVERTVPNGLALTAPDGSGRLTDYWVETAMPALDAPTADPVRGGHPERVFPGLTRRLTASGHDETYGPAPGAPRWRATGGRIDDNGVFTAGARDGAAKATARRGAADGTVELTVLDPLDRIQPTTRRVGLADATATGTFGVVGLDASGTSAPIEPADVELDYDRAQFDVTPTATGFGVKARTERAAGRIGITVAGRTTALAVTAGLAEQAVAAFDDASSWTFTQARAAGSVAPTPDGRTGTGLTLTYDFTRSTATRAAYANPPAQIPVEGQPQAFSLWIKGDGKGTWPTLHLKDAAGSDQLLRGPYVTWTGWRQVDFTVPAGIAYPVKVHRFYLTETKPGAQYTGEVVIDDLTAKVPPAVDVPTAPVAKDPLIGTAADVAGRDWRFAVMSDAQFVAREPDSALASQARRTLREIRAADPDFLVVNGDLVDEGSPADLAFAREMLETELGDAVPWYYVPGNHEVMGGSIENFTTEFGAADRVFDHRGTRFVTLDTSRLGLRASGFDQIRRFRAALDAAAKDRTVGSVVVVAHVPPRDHTPQQGSQLGDRKEAALVEGWLADFRRTSGKGAAFVGGHIGAFHASRVDGVPYLVNGNSAKTPSTPPGAGGFTGWSLIGVDRAGRGSGLGSGDDWLSVQTRAHVDTLTLDAPAAVRPGEEAEVTAAVGQGARTVPVRWPLSADWTGSPNLHIGPAGKARPRHVAAFDPATGVLTGLRPGEATLAVTVNGERREARVEIAASGGVVAPAA